METKPQNQTADPEPEFILDSLGRKRYPHKYKNGKPDEEISQEEFEEALKKKDYADLLRDTSYLSMVFWTGARRTEPLEMYKENLKPDHDETGKEIILVSIPAKKMGKRGGELQLSLEWPGVDLIIKHWLTVKKKRKIWPMSSWTAARIIQKAFPGKTPHYLRYRFITSLRREKDRGNLNIDDIKAWTGLKRDSTIEGYGLKTQAGINKISGLLGKSIKEKREPGN